MSQFLLLAGVSCRMLTIDTGLSKDRLNVLGEGCVIALPCLNRRFYVPQFSFNSINQLVNQSDVVHLIGHWTILNALVYLAIRRAKKPYVICPAGALSIFGRSKMLKNVYNFIIGNKIIRNAARCIAVTAEEKNYFILSGIAAEKILVIPNGISGADFTSDNVATFREKYALKCRPFILFVGRLNLIKGPDLLLQAFCNLKEKFPNIDLVFVGPDGGMQAQLKALAEVEGVVSRVHFIGYLGGAEKSDAYHAAELLVIPSRHEAMSIVALEAGICGTPVLLTDQCGFDQLAKAGGGWVVSASIAGLEKGMQVVFTQPELIASAAFNIKRYVTQYFAWDILIQSYKNLYVQLANSLLGGK